MSEQDETPRDRRPEAERWPRDVVARWGLPRTRIAWMRTEVDPDVQHRWTIGLTCGHQAAVTQQYGVKALFPPEVGLSMYCPAFINGDCSGKPS